jgi:nucleoside-diphosphate-sugar epimerase
MERNILVTGGFGFLGSHLVEQLLADQETRVHVVDDLRSSPIDVNMFVTRLGNPKNLTWEITSIERYAQRGALGAPPYKEIYHLASVVGPVGVLEHGGRIVRSIVDDTYHIVALAKAHGARLCDISTSEVYGGGRDGYCSETDAKIIPPKNSVRLEYAVAKLACEVALVNMSQVDGLDVVIIRPFNIAGPRQSGKGGFVLPRFIGQALRGEPLTVYGDGKMIRAFTHVADVANCVVLAARKGRKGEAYNAGNPANRIAIGELANRVVAIVGSKGGIGFVDPKTLFGPLFEEANDKYPDAHKTMSELGWQPRYDLETVIKDSLNYLRQGRKD